METPLDFVFEIDESAFMQLRGENEQLPFDRDLALAFYKENNISFVITKQEKMMSGETGKPEGLHLAYRLTAQANEKCHFQNVQCMIDLGQINGIVRDMDPGESKEGDAVKHTYKDTGELTFKLAKLAIDAKIGGEESVEINRYIYDVIAFGLDKPYARWEFRQPANRELRLDNILQVLAETPPDLPEGAPIEITVRFKLRADNFLGIIPFWGRKKIPLNFKQQL